MPVVGSAICLIEDHRFYYRGRDALALAETATLEDVAAILWDDKACVALTPRPREPGHVSVEKGAIERCQIRLAELAATDLAALDLTRSGVVRSGRLILGELATSVGESAPSSLPVHRQLGTECSTYSASCPRPTPILRPGRTREFANMTSAASTTMPTAVHGT